MIFQNFGFNRKYVRVGGVSGVSFPDQSLTTWTTTQTAQWLSAGSSLCNTTTFGYASSTSRIGSALGTSDAKWGPGALASNGKIYAAPHTQTSWLIINTNDDTVTTTGSVNGSSQGVVWDKITNTVYGFGSGGTKIVCSTDASSNISGPANRSLNPVQTFNGDNLYTAGFTYNGIRRYNISGNSTTSMASTSQAYGEQGTGGSDGCCYWGNVPGGSNILKYDPSTDTASTIAIGASGTFPTLIQHYDGYIYLLPTNSSSNIRKLNVSTGTISLAHTYSSNFQASSACIGLDGRIYIVSSINGVQLLRWFDPTANTSGDITVSNSDSSFQGITLGANGDIYLIPWRSQYVHKLALTTGTGTTATNIISQYNFGGRMVWPG